MPDERIPHYWLVCAIRESRSRLPGGTLWQYV